MVRIATVFGARPQFVKAAVVSRVLRDRCDEIVIDTGQHYDYEMAGAFLDQLEMHAPDYNLGVGSSTHARQTGEMMVRIEEVLQREKPDFVLVYGDTNSTLAGALAAVKLHLPIGHVEAGPRNYSWKIPEEVNRIVADRFSALLFCATELCVENLRREGLTEGVLFTGDVMYDLFLAMKDRVRAESHVLDELDVEPGTYVLGTLHRPNNTDVDERLKAICEAFLESGQPTVLPLHPRAVKNLERIGWYERVAGAPHLHVIKPQGYRDFLRLELDARIILTDSGGVQREAYFARKPCVTIFQNTAWPETVEDGWNVCIDADKAKLLEAIESFAPTHPQRQVFGDGSAGPKIVDAILAFLDDPRPIYV